MFKPTNPYNLQKTNAVVREMKTTLNRRRNNLQTGELYYEAVGKNTRRNASKNKLYMNSLRKGSNSPTPTQTLKNKPTYAPTPYIKVSGVQPGTTALSCQLTNNNQYLCFPVKGQ